MISYWLFTFAGKNTNIGREKDQYFCRITKSINQVPTRKWVRSGAPMGNLKKGWEMG